MENYYTQQPVYHQQPSYTQNFHHNGGWADYQHAGSRPNHAHFQYQNPGHLNVEYPAHWHQGNINQNRNTKQIQTNQFELRSKPGNITSTVDIHNFLNHDPRGLDDKTKRQYPDFQHSHNHDVYLSKDWQAQNESRNFINSGYRPSPVLHQQNMTKQFIPRPLTQVLHEKEQHLFGETTPQNQTGLAEMNCQMSSQLQKQEIQASHIRAGGHCGKIINNHEHNSQINVGKRCALDELDDFLTPEPEPQEPRPEVGPCLSCYTLDCPLCTCSKFAFCNIFCQIEANHYCSSKRMVPSEDHSSENYSAKEVYKCDFCSFKTTHYRGLLSHKTKMKH